MCETNSVCSLVFHAELGQIWGQLVWPDTNLNKYSKTLDGFVPEMHMWECERLF